MMPKIDIGGRERSCFNKKLKQVMAGEG